MHLIPDRPGLMYMDYYIPEDKISIEQLLEDVDECYFPTAFPDKEEYTLFAESVLNLDHIRITKDLDSKDMVNGLIKKMFTMISVIPSEIDFVITTQDAGEDYTKNFGQYLINEYNLSNATTVNISGNHCANLDVAFSIADKFIKSGKDYVLVIDILKVKSSKNRIIGSYGILGDSSGILLFSSTNSIITLIDTYTLVNGKLFDADLNKDYSMLHIKYYLSGIQKLRSRHQSEFLNLRSIIVQNANPLLITQAIKLSGLDTGLIFTENFGLFGHMNSLDFLINLKSVVQDNLFLNAGDCVLSIGVGWAGTYVFTLLKIN